MFSHTASAQLFVLMPAESAVTDVVLSLVLLLEVASVVVFFSELFHLTLRSFVRPTGVTYVQHFVLMVVSTVLFLGVEIVLLRTV